jgi:cyclomaltodextrinase
MAVYCFINRVDLSILLISTKHYLTAIVEMKSNQLSGLAILFFLGTFLFSCSDKSSSIIEESNYNAVGLLTAITLEPNETRIEVLDYFVEPQLIDSISFSEGKVRFSDDKKFFVFEGEVNQQLGTLNIYSGDTTYAILVNKSAKQEITFNLADPEKQYNIVQAFGDFNEYNPQLGEMTWADGQWSIKFFLQPGRYQYKFKADGREMTDPLSKDSLDNNFGSYNSVMWVENPSEIIPRLMTAEYNGYSVTLAVSNTNNIVALWQNQRINDEAISIGDGRISVNIPKAASKVKRSYLRINGYNANNISNDILIPLEFGKVVNTAEQLSRSDWHANSLYFMMVDRFNNADTSNDGTMNHPEILPQADYYGGDIKGITEKVRDGYFQELGVNSIWLSPIVQNSEGAWGLYPKPRTKFSAYHGYWPTSFSKVDYRYGTPEELKELVQVAHENDLNVLIDFVANHVHKEHWVYQQHPDWATELYLPDGSLNTERWDEYRLTTWFDTHLPTLDLMNPELTDMLTDSAVFWLKEYNIDGFRHDATKHVPEYFWRESTKKIKKQVIRPENKEVYQIGETYGSRELIASYVNSGQMTAQFDFGIYDDALPTFARADVPFGRLQNSINESFKYYGEHHLMGNVTGNQDKARFMAFAGGDLQFGEDYKLAGWTRDITVTNPLGYEKLKMFHAFDLTIPGIPVIYYGDEFGMTGANDPDNRRMMRFDLDKPDEIEVRNTVSRLIKLRKESLELSYGDFTWLTVEDDIMSFARSYFDQISIIAFNKSSEAATIQVKLPDHYAATALVDLIGESVDNTNGYVTIDIQPYSFTIIQNQ